MRFGSVINKIMEESRDRPPEVGMGVTRILWSDRQAWSVVEVYPEGKKIRVRQDRAVVMSGSAFDGSAVYRFLPQEDGREAVLTLRSNGKWVQRGEPMRGGCGWLIGVREEYVDPSF
jgi:hypothetical protein